MLHNVAGLAYLKGSCRVPFGSSPEVFPWCSFKTRDLLMFFFKFRGLPTVFLKVQGSSYGIPQDQGASSHGVNYISG